MVLLLGIIRYGFALLFGVSIAYIFTGIDKTLKNIFSIGCFCVSAILIQSLLWYLWGYEITSKLYPFIIHLPLIIFITLYFKRPWLISIVGVLSSYLCCQVPRWIGSVANAISNNPLYDHITYIVAVFIVFYFLNEYVAGSVLRLIEKSKKSCLLFGAVPLFYYIFDYVTTIYTNLLYSGSRGAVQFMPSVVSVFYFVFIIVYYAEIQKQARAQRERDMLSSQLHLAKTEFATLRQLQECTTVYRHDMRHHITFLKALAADNSLDKIKEYLNATEQDMDAITPVRFCENETVNLILSYFATKAKEADVFFSAAVKLPASLTVSDTELCSLLSNGLENAITAAADCLHANNKTVSIVAAVHKSKLLISIENPYEGKVIIKGGLPQPSMEGHGYGTRSITAIADAHAGQALFNIEDGIFKLKVMLPF